MALARKPPTGKLFTHGRGQAVRLPAEFHMRGTEVRISRDGDKLILEPLEVAPSEEKTTPFDVKAWRERMRALGAADFLPEGRPEQPPMPKDVPSFD